MELGILRKIFTRLPNLEYLKINNLRIDSGIDEFELFAKSLQSGKLKTLFLNGAPITSITAFQRFCNALPFSEIETIGIESSSYFFFQLDFVPLINVLPYLPSLKQLSFKGEKRLNKFKLIRILEYTQIQYLRLINVELKDEEAILLARKILLTKLIFLDVRYNSLSIRARKALRYVTKFKPGFNLMV